MWTAGYEAVETATPALCAAYKTRLVNFTENQVGRAHHCSERLVAPMVEGHGEDEQEDLAQAQGEQGGNVLDETVEELSEAAPLRKPTIPVMPSLAEVEEHRRTHWPYRTWCKFCNMGRGLGEQRGGRDQPHAIPIVGVDYFFITTEGFKLRKELKHAETE